MSAQPLSTSGRSRLLYAFNQREKIYDMCELVSGQRFHPSYTRVGGLLRDVDDHWMAWCVSSSKSSQSPSDVSRLLNRNRHFHRAHERYRHLSKEEAINLS